MSPDKRELLERYEIRGDEADYLAAKLLYQEAVAHSPDATVLRDYGFLLEWHGRDELRQSVEQYRRAIELDPEDDKLRYQLIGALGALRDTDEMVDLYRQRVRAAPDDVREKRFLASAYLAAGGREEARAVIEAGLELEPQDPALTAMRGEIAAANGQVEAALADWRRSLELDTTNVEPLFGIAYLLEHEGRLDEAIDAWQSILAWNEAQGTGLEAEFPRRELERLAGATR